MSCSPVTSDSKGNLVAKYIHGANLDERLTLTTQFALTAADE
jgi:hypothetical protein